MDQNQLFSPDMTTDPCFEVEWLNDHRRSDQFFQRFHDSLPSLPNFFSDNDIVDRPFPQPSYTYLNQFDNSTDNLFPLSENFSDDFHQYENHLRPPLPSYSMQYLSYPPTAPLFTLSPTPPLDLLPPFHRYLPLPNAAADTFTTTASATAPYFNGGNTITTSQEHEFDMEMNSSQDGILVVKPENYHYPDYSTTQIARYYDEELQEGSDRDDYSGFEVAEQDGNDQYGAGAAGSNGTEALMLGSSRYSRRRTAEELGFDEIQKYFHMPIAAAARRLNVGLTVLKRRCRQLNIQRWPHRKIKSLKCLIRNVKELGLGIEVEMLEENARMIQELPCLDLPDKTKKLRQHCFKVNYKKKRATERSR